MEINQVYLGLGSNLGDRQKSLAIARTLIAKRVGKIEVQSAIYETAAWGLTNQNDFLNQVIRVSTSCQPEEVLVEVLAIEQAMGRMRKLKWGARIIDIDILYYNEAIVALTNLVIPHPFIQERRFVLEPLAEIAAGFIHPVLKLTNAQLLMRCADTSPVVKKQ